MRRLTHRLFGALRALVRREPLDDRDLDDELRAYFDEAVERHMQDGMSHAEALRTVRLEVGSPA